MAQSVLAYVVVIRATSSTWLDARWALDELEEMMQEFEDPAFVDQVQKLVNVIRAGIPQNKGTLANCCGSWIRWPVSG